MHIPLLDTINYHLQCLKNVFLAPSWLNSIINWFLLRLAIFLWLLTRLCMKKVMASPKTWKPTTTSFERGWLFSFWLGVLHRRWFAEGRDLCGRPQWHFHLHDSWEPTTPSDLFQVHIFLGNKKTNQLKIMGGNERANCNLTFWWYWGSQAGRGAEAWKFPWWLPQPGGLP